MTVLGKILVFVNLGLSLLMATWAFAVWSNRIDFSNTTAKGEETAGEFEKRKLVIDALYKSLPSAEAAWAEARATLTDKEAHRLADNGWYHDEMNHLRNKATAADPARTVVYADRDDDKTGTRKGRILLDPSTGRPVLAPAKGRSGNALLSLAQYGNEEQKLLASMEVVQNKHQDQIKEAIKLTESMVGVPPADKGLQQRLLDERKKRDDVVAEEGLIRPLLINGVVDSELILKRKKALELRIEELKKIGVALQGR